MKLIHKDNSKNYIIALIALIISAIAFPMLPKEIAVHFDAQGIADGYGSRLTVFLIPCLMLLTNVLAEFTKHADPRAANYPVFSKHYYLFFLVLNVFLFLVQLYLITYSLEIITFNISNIVVVCLGLLFIFTGNMMPKIKQNFFMGIKTPWALADEHVWYETHRFGGKLWFILGLILCICGFLPGTAQIPAVLIAAAIAAIAPTVYSYIIFKRRPSK